MCARARVCVCVVTRSGPYILGARKWCSTHRYTQWCSVALRSLVATNTQKQTHTHTHTHTYTYRQVSRLFSRTRARRAYTTHTYTRTHSHCCVTLQPTLPTLSTVPALVPFFAIRSWKIGGKFYSQKLYGGISLHCQTLFGNIATHTHTHTHTH